MFKIIVSSVGSHYILTKGTLDKANPAVRKYIAQRTDLFGAIRLPNNAFKDNTGTEVTTDIIFLQKRDRIIDIEPDWVHLGQLTVDNGQLTVPILCFALWKFWMKTENLPEKPTCSASEPSSHRLPSPAWIRRWRRWPSGRGHHGAQAG